MMRIIYCFIVLGFLFSLITGVNAAKDNTLVLYFMFDDLKTSKDVVTDTSEYKNNGTIKGSPKMVAGKNGSALEFAASDYVEVPPSDSLDILEDITIAVWLNHAGGQGTVLSKVYSYWLGFNPDIEFAYQKGGANALPHTGQDIPVGEWAHLAVTQDKSGQILFYVDGKEIFKATNPVPRDTSALPLVIAQGAWGAASYLGAIDEIRIYNRVLGVAEINRIMTTFGTAVESSGKLATSWGEIKKQ
jgi:hypothetical protein